MSNETAPIVLDMGPWALELHDNSEPDFSTLTTLERTLWAARLRHWLNKIEPISGTITINGPTTFTPKPVFDRIRDVSGA